MKPNLTHLLTATTALLSLLTSEAAQAPRWSAEKANEWYARQPWLVGCNFAPSTAINQLEMWQADTFDLPTIDRELGWAAQLGFTSMRVFLHDLPWKEDREGFVRRIGQYLEVADKHRIGTMLVLFDSVWDPHPKSGKQRAPKPHVHNSGWVQSPGADILKDPKRQDELKPYVQDILRRFANDRRVQIWDLFNEADNRNQGAYGKVELTNKMDCAQMLLEKTFTWAREVNPAQPLTAGIWDDGKALKDQTRLTRFLLDHVDVITFHNYASPADMREEVIALKKYGRPVVCTEYMARTVGSTFDPILGLLQSEKVGAYSWGFVSGKTQTIYPWETWDRTYTAEPPVWFHDILRADGTPFRAEEANYIKGVTARARR